MRFAWEELIIIAFGMILLRISGRKSIAQMTIAQTMVMISIGTIIVHPILETSLLKTLITAVPIIFYKPVLQETKKHLKQMPFFRRGPCMRPNMLFSRYTHRRP